jgi:hypothetical protein
MGGLLDQVKQHMTDAWLEVDAVTAEELSMIHGGIAAAQPVDIGGLPLPAIGAYKEVILWRFPDGFLMLIVTPMVGPDRFFTVDLPESMPEIPGQNTGLPPLTNPIDFCLNHGGEIICDADEALPELCQCLFPDGTTCGALDFANGLCNPIAQQTGKKRTWVPWAVGGGLLLLVVGGVVWARS